MEGGGLMGAGPSLGRTPPKWIVLQATLLAGLPSPSWQPGWLDAFSYRCSELGPLAYIQGPPLYIKYKYHLVMSH